MQPEQAYRPPVAQPGRGERSAGIGATAVVALIGSVIVVLFGGLMLTGSVLASLDPAAMPPGEGAELQVVIGMGIGAVGLAVWGIASAIGLLRLKEWARVSFVVFAVLLLAWSALMTLGALAALAAPPPLPPDAPPWLATAVAVPLFLMAAAGVGCGLWWLIAFNRAHVKAQFTAHKDGAAPEGAATATTSRLPVRILIVASLMILSVLLVPLMLFNPAPALLFGILVQGPGAVALVALQSVAAGLAGIALLLKYSRAHALAVAVLAFGSSSGVVSLLVPGAVRRLNALTVQSSGMPAPWSEDWAVPIHVAGLVLSGAILWMLMSGRRRFLQACQEKRGYDARTSRTARNQGA